MKNLIILTLAFVAIFATSCTSPQESLKGTWKIMIPQEFKDPKEFTLIITTIEGEDFKGFMEGGKHYMEKRPISGTCVKYTGTQLYRVYFRETAGNDYVFDFEKRVKKGKEYQGKTGWYKINFYIKKITSDNLSSETIEDSPWKLLKILLGSLVICIIILGILAGFEVF